MTTHQETQEPIYKFGELVVKEYGKLTGRLKKQGKTKGLSELEMNKVFWLFFDIMGKKVKRSKKLN